MATAPQPHGTPAEPPGDGKKLLKLVLLLVADWLDGDRKNASEIAELARRLKTADEGQPPH